MFNLFEGLIDFALSATGIVSATASYETSTGSRTNVPGRTGRAVMALSLLLAAGTGSLPSKANAQPSTSSRVVIQERLARRNTETPSAPSVATEEVSVAGRLRTVQEQLSLNTKQLADSMLVGRPAVYGWLQQGITPREVQQIRLKALYDIAREWSASNDTPVGKLLVAPLDGGESLAMLLRSETLDRERISKVFRSLAATVQRASNQRQASRYKSVASLMQEKGINAPSSSVQRQRLDELTDF
ncbi:MAG: hypothetical protein JWM41_3812 [Gemmatimonadetes bacterium]|nr:hypothetical protein [Gemmatimonadota bacterium]